MSPARQLAADLAEALTPYLSSPDAAPADCAREVANNAAAAIDCGEEPAETVRSMLMHRRSRFALQIGDLEMAVADAARVAGRWNAGRAA